MQYTASPDRDERKNTIIGVIELREQKVGYETTQKRYGVGSSTVTLIMKRFRELGIPLEELKAMSPKNVEATFYPPENLQRTTKPQPDFFMIHARMAAMEHPNLAFLWLEYKEEHPNGYQRSQFYELYREFLAENFGQTSVTMPVERIPGERMFIDWVGDQPALLLEPATGELKKVHVFTATLGFSSRVYAEVFPDEKLQSFITGVVHALAFYGAVPKYLVPDNLKAAVIRHSKDELVLNSVFSDLEDFYDVVVLPPPPRKPKGKPSVENHVRYLETHLLERLKEHTFTSIEAMNLETRKIVEDINLRDFRNKQDVRRSRKHAFEAYDNCFIKADAIALRRISCNFITVWFVTVFRPHFTAAATSLLLNPRFFSLRISLQSVIFDDLLYLYYILRCNPSIQAFFLNAPSPRRLCTILAERMHHQRGQLAPSRPAYSF